MRKKIIYLAGLLMLGTALCLLAGCQKSSKNISLPEFSFTPIEYPDYRFEERYLESDDFITIDGKLDEAFWKEQNYLTRAYGDFKFSITTKYGEKGVYFGISIDDKNVHVNPKKEDWRNTGIELHIASAAAKNREDAVMLRINPANVTMESMRGTYAENSINGYMWGWVPFYVKSYIDAEYEKDFISVTEGNGLSFEVMVPWDGLGMSGPGKVLCLPAYNHTESYEVEEHLNYFHLQYEGSMFEISTWPSFDESGSTIPSDSENDIVGDALKGAYKSAGWDLSKRSKGVITADGHQQIWFRKEASTAYTVETTISNAKPSNDAWPSGGIILADDLTGKGICIQLFIGYNGEGNNEWIKIYDLQRSEPCIRYINLGGSTGAKTSSGCKLKAMRNGQEYCIFVNGQLIYKDSSELLGNASIAGLYTVGMKATFSKFSYDSSANIPSKEAAVGVKGIIDVQSLGWDLSQIGNKKVSAVGSGLQEVHFSKPDSTSYTIEATVSNVTALNDGWPSVGFIAGADANGVGLRFQLFTGWEGKGMYHFFKVYDNGMSEPCIKLVDLPTTTGVETAEGARLKLVRNGTKVTFYINNEMVYSGSSELLANAGYAGFYANGCTATFSDYSYKAN